MRRGERAREAVGLGFERRVAQPRALHDDGVALAVALRGAAEELGQQRDRAHRPRQRAMILRCISEVPE